ncbi:MAG: hypothetical protein FWJ87_04805 [Micromonosporaceae bacterium]
MRRASDLAAGGTAGARADRLLPVAPQLRPLLPGLRRGGSVAVHAGTSVLLALLAEASASGAWSAVVGMPDLGLRAAAEAGVALERLALVPWPGPEWTTVVAALLDGVEVVVVAPPGPVGDRTAGRLAARARQRGSVLVACGQWPGAELTLTAGPGEWSGLGRGHGRLRFRELEITAQGRGAAARPRRVRVRLPDPTGRLAAVPEEAGRSAVAPGPDGRPATVPGSTGRRRPVAFLPGRAPIAAHLASAPATGRPRLTVVRGG